MALDQFLILVEKKFNVDLMEADDIDTLDKLAGYIEEYASKMPHSQEEADRLFQSKIAELRSIVAQEAGIDESTITPTTDLGTVLKTMSVRRRTWKKMQQGFSENVPPLTSKAYNIVGGFVSVCIGIVVMISVMIMQNPTNPNPMPMVIMLGCIAAGIMGFGCYMSGCILFGMFFATIPQEGRTIEDIVHYAIPMQICVDRNGQAWTRESIEKAVLRIASKTSGIPVEKISLSMPIIET